MCDESFWSWFARPFAELLAGIAMIVGFTAIAAIIIFLIALYRVYRQHSKPR